MVVSHHSPQRFRTMSKRLFLGAGFALTLLALSPSIGRAQAGGRITVEWQNAPLSDVVRGFATFSGRTIVLAPDAGDPEVTAAYQNIDWQLALDLILERLGLVARVDSSGVIRIEKRNAAPAKR
jgi:ferric-dicitrate binding protein FerR (iron transport regulator)